MITLRSYALASSIADDIITDKNTIVAEFFIDSVSDLPANKTYKIYTLFQGSIAYDISTGKFYVMDSEGVWHDSEDGTVVST